jgi:putative hydrolase of the HAD superfamily
MIHLVRELKAKYNLKVVVVSNEARDLNAYRIRKFHLDEFVDSFVSSCFVHMRKPDKNIFKLALDIAQVVPAAVVFIDNTALFVEIAGELSIQGIHHTDVESTRSKLAAFGLFINVGQQQHANPNA